MKTFLQQELVMKSCNWLELLMSWNQLHHFYGAIFHLQLTLLICSFGIHGFDLLLFWHLEGLKTSQKKCLMVMLGKLYLASPHVTKWRHFQSYTDIWCSPYGFCYLWILVSTGVVCKWIPHGYQSQLYNKIDLCFSKKRQMYVNMLIIIGK